MVSLNNLQPVGSTYSLVSSPDCEGKGLGTLERFLGCVHQHYIISIAHDVARYFRSWCSFGPKESKTSLVIKPYHRRAWHKQPRNSITGQLSQHNQENKVVVQ